MRITVNATQGRTRSESAAYPRTGLNTELRMRAPDVPESSRVRFEQTAYAYISRSTVVRAVAECV